MSMFNTDIVEVRSFFNSILLYDLRILNPTDFECTIQQEVQGLPCLVHYAIKGKMPTLKVLETDFIQLALE